MTEMKECTRKKQKKQVGSRIELMHSFHIVISHDLRERGKKNASLVGLEPTTSGLEVRRAIHCATGTAEGCRNMLI